MSFRLRIRFTFSLLVVMVVLTACFHQKTPTEKIYDILEKVVVAEKGFEEQQEPLVTLERKEKVEYDKIIGLGMKQYDQIVKLSNEAISMVDKRKQYMEKETESIKKSKNEFMKIAKLKDEIKDPTIKKQVDNLYDVMMQRYKVHETLYKEYVKGANGDKKLYQMFKDKNLSIEDLETQVNDLNGTYQKIYNTNLDFNKLTKSYNVIKVKFYKQAELNKEK
ncbi:YkyA family protein [Neobacillus sp. PS3-40]|uniref:YkyA family protein n=1 Tax=Neobacillus sp. PS3-40 TaxID=3070679 RepID=UPI0027E1ED09|nr:YkyA family protein [Neobacillus sp. PS3-40]WML43551.1 YkyA family protein [Neobacillus sp. PS3-40]